MCGIVVAVLANRGAFVSCPENTYRICDGANVGDGCTCYRHDRVEKPLVYLYPVKEQEVSIKLGPPEKLIASYPLYDDGWKVLASPSGKLLDLKTNRELYSLYWEGNNGDYKITDEGFIVPRDDSINFLEEKLAILGLNEREAEEFIVYWLPKMLENEYNYVRFADREEIENYMPLIVSPNPDTTIRVVMILKGLDEPISINEQKLEIAPKRKGFTLVEWGGTPIE